MPVSDQLKWTLMVSAIVCIGLLTVGGVALNWERLVYAATGPDAANFWFLFVIGAMVLWIVQHQVRHWLDIADE